ncbi:hypothetical protein H7K62_19025 [Quadrisphaera sp. RL12-1S]|uniref:hypothetical protein n=1 Tax=Quadrisphaera sp. RL12-1S TaxID=2763011 RepID=UPI001647A14E|nr:hypothetical protein [Quadrisphaera sp. RL12-1S]MBC3763788.1 hypothetical protein [Quadrisphaera sp. RL12-1S]
MSTAASSRSTAADETGATASPAAVQRPESSSAGSQTRSSDDGDSGDRSATGTYLASLLAAQITGRPPAEGRPVKITPERLASLITYLEATVASTQAARSPEEHAVDVKS